MIRQHVWAVEILLRNTNEFVRVDQVYTSREDARFYLCHLDKDSDYKYVIRKYVPESFCDYV